MAAGVQPEAVRVIWPVAARRGTYYRLPNSPAALHAMASCLTGSDRQAARRHRHPERRRAFLIASALLRFALSEVLGRPPGRIGLERRPRRRPRVLSPRWTGGVALSVAHTERWILVGVLPGRLRLGLDLEQAGRQPTANLAQRLPWPDTDKTALLLQRWTLVEAALKAHGLGLTGLRALQLRGSGHQGWRFLSEDWPIRSAALTGLPGYPGVVGAVAVAEVMP
ncbi:MAG: hypothetical protein JJT88_08430 [Gammaproteobacteria bacterium]|nr:hypothetical protein [Gammaproteobacteria bacterium]